jgi:hypothetical protein
MTGLAISSAFRAQRIGDPMQDIETKSDMRYALAAANRLLLAHDLLYHNMEHIRSVKAFSLTPIEAFIAFALAARDETSAPY